MKTKCHGCWFYLKFLVLFLSASSFWFVYNLLPVTFTIALFVVVIHFCLQFWGVWETDTLKHTCIHSHPFFRNGVMLNDCMKVNLREYIARERKRESSRIFEITFWVSIRTRGWFYKRENSFVLKLFSNSLRILSVYRMQKTTVCMCAFVFDGM